MFTMRVLALKVYSDVAERNLKSSSRVKFLQNKWNVFLRNFWAQNKNLSLHNFGRLFARTLVYGIVRFLFRNE